MKKRFLSVFMVLCMMLTMVPSAFAEGADGDTLQNKINQASENANCRSEEHTSELQSRPHISYAVFCLKKDAGNGRKRDVP